MKSSFEIKRTPGNKDNSLPEHHDIFVIGQGDQLATIWFGEDMANEFAFYLDHRAEFKTWMADKKRAVAA